MDENLSRDTYPNPFDEDGQDIRVYTKEQDNGQDIHMPSVTTVLDTRDDDKSNLYAWQDRNDGEGDNAFHKHLFWYSRNVGTLGHWHALAELNDGLEWTEDEAESTWALANVQHLNDDEDVEAQSDALGDFTVDGENHEEVHSSSPREVLYSVLKSQHAVETWGEFYDEHSPHESHDYYSKELVKQAKRDVEFFHDAQERLWSKLGIDQESIIAVEKFLFNEEFKYAGQVDMVYKDPNGHIVVADLKSSSGCYDKHQMQGAAYGKAIELADDVPVDHVDRLEVHRTHPRSGQMAVHTHADAMGQTDMHTTKYWNDGFESLWQDFERLTSNFDDVDFYNLE